MFAPATPLVPDDQDHEREFIPRDLDQERKQRRQLERVNRSVAIRRPPIIKCGQVACSRLRGGFAWHRPYDRLAISRGARKRDRHGLGSVLGTLTDCLARLVIAGSEHNLAKRQCRPKSCSR